MNIKIKEADELDQATQITTLIQETARYSTPMPLDTTKHSHNIPLHIRELVAEKRRARNRWQRSRNEDDRINYNKLKRRLDNTLTDARNTTFEQYITSLNKDDHTIWKSTKQFTRPQIPIPPIKKATGSWAKSHREKAENFAEYFH
jgi:hypothetical protein